MDNEKPKLISMDSLLIRCSPFAKKDGENFTKKGLYNWRKNRIYPEPVITTSRLVWRIADVGAWEIAQRYDFLLIQLWRKAWKNYKYLPTSIMPTMWHSASTAN